MLTGPSAAGKSSFCRLLLGSEKFSDEYNSTDIMVNKLAFLVVKSSSAQKEEVEPVNSRKEVVWYELNLEKQIKYLKSLLVDEKFHEEKLPHKNIDDNKHKSSNKDDVNDDNHDEALPKKPQTEIVKELVKAEPLPDGFTIETVKLVSIVDTGGQPEYIHLLPAINNYPTVTFIVHDLTKGLDDPVQVRYKKIGCEEDQPRNLHYSYLDMMHLLTCFVSDSLKQELPESRFALPKNSYIRFVGTHYDRVPEVDKETTIGNVNSKLRQIVEEKNFGSGMVQSSKKGIIHPVDNTTSGNNEKEDKEVKYIRSQIENTIDEMESATLPITWMILQLRIQQVCAEKYILTYEEYTKIAKECNLYDENEIKAAVKYFHFIGLLLHFEDPSLCDYVIINLQWLYSSLAKIMRLSLKDVHIPDTKHQLIFDKQRLLVKNGFKLSDCSETINEPELKYCFDLLIHLTIIATVTIDDTEFYYLPCVLSTLTLCDARHKHLLSEPLLIRFESGFLPRGFFCSLVVHLLNTLPKKWNHQLNKSTKNYSDLMIFLLLDKSYLYLHDKIFYLKVEVRHEKKYFEATKHSELIFELHKYLMLVCNQLRFNPEHLQYGFLCLVEERDSDHIVVIDLGLSKEMPDELECTQCSDKHYNETQLDYSNRIWFEEVSVI